MSDERDSGRLRARRAISRPMMDSGQDRPPTMGGGAFCAAARPCLFARTFSWPKCCRKEAANERKSAFVSIIQRHIAESQKRERAPIGAADVAGSAPITAPADGTAGPGWLAGGCRFPAARGEIESARWAEPASAPQPRPRAEQSDINEPPLFMANRGAAAAAGRAIVSQRARCERALLSSSSPSSSSHFLGPTSDIIYRARAFAPDERAK